MKSFYVIFDRVVAEIDDNLIITYESILVTYKYVLIQKLNILKNIYIHIYNISHPKSNCKWIGIPKLLPYINTKIKKILSILLLYNTGNGKYVFLQCDKNLKHNKSENFMILQFFYHF